MTQRVTHDPAYLALHALGRLPQQENQQPIGGLAGGSRDELTLHRVLGPESLAVGKALLF
jgi:hypothetical protein